MDYADFGRYLSQQRELRGLSREDVAKATKIPLNLIVALEDGQVDRLPARVFVLNYVRAFARAIGHEPEEAVLRYEEIDRTVKTAPPPAALERKRRIHAWIVLSVVLALILAGAVALWISAARHGAIH